MKPVEPITICLVGCGSAKLARSARAKDLYTGSLFRAARAFAEQCDDWRILSARYGLLNPELRIAPYNQRMYSSALERQQWGRIAASSLIYEFRRISFKVIVLAGEDYAEPIVRFLVEEQIQCDRPLEGMGLGKRLQWLKQQLAPELER